MSILRSKHSGWTYEGRRTPFMGGGGGSPPPSQNTTYTTNVPEYARPYVENMLESTQKQIYTDDMAGFRPYKPYSTDVNQYFAGFSPLQQQAQQATYGLQTPGQYGTATGLAGSAGMGGLGAVQQAGALGGQALGYGATGSEYGGMGAQQALARAQQTGRQAGMYGGMGAGYGAQAAGMAPTAQRFGQEAADIGMGGLGYGAMGAGYGGMGVQAAQQGFGAGEAFARQATDPYATQAYMSPYMQNVVDYQKSQALRDYNIAKPMRQAQAVGKGAFGGSRQAIMEAEAERSLGSQLQGIAATGSQKAFEDAQRQQQFGANLGLQGLQAGYGGLGLGMQGAGVGLQGLGTALQGQQARMAGLGQAGQFLGQGMQGAGLGLQGVGAQQAAGQLGLAGTAQGMQGAGMGLQGVQGAVGAGQYGLQGLGQATQAAGALGQLGQQQFGAQKDIINLQSQMGKEQQALEQNKINQAIQDYAISQQYPFMQLGMMNAMLRGLPMQTQSTQLYQAQPSMLQQGIGLAGAGASLFGGGGRAAGGAIKEYREGGIVGYAPGGVIDSTRADLEQIADMPGGMQKLEAIRNSSSSKEVRKMAGEIIVQKQVEAKAEQQAQQSRMGGIAAAGGGLFDTMGYAGGGILAFSNGGMGMTNPEFGGGDQPFDVRKPMTLEELFKEYPGLEGNVGIAQIQDYTSGRSAPPESARAKPVTAAPVAAAPKPDTKPPVAKEKDVDTAEGTSGKAGTPPTTPKDFKSFLSEIKGAGPKGQVGEEFEKFLGEQMGDPNRLSRKERLAMAKGFLKFGSTAGPIGKAAIEGFGEYATGAEAARDAEDKIKSETAKARMELDKARRAEQRGDVAAARESTDKYEDSMRRIQAAQIGAGAAGAPQRYTEQQIQNVMAENPGMSYTEALTRVAGAGRTENVEVQRAKAAQEALNKNIPYLRLMQSKKPEDQAKAKQIRDEIFGNFGLLAPGGGIGGGQGGSGNLVPNKDGSFNYVLR